MNNEENEETQHNGQTDELEGIEAPLREELDEESLRDEPDTGDAPASRRWAVLEVLFYDWVEPDVFEPSGEEFYAFKSRNAQSPNASRRFRKFNNLLKGLKIVKIERTYQVPFEQADALKEVARQQGMLVPNLGNIFTLYFPEGANVERIVQRIKKLPEVAEAAPVPLTKPPQAAPNEPLLGNSNVVNTSLKIYNQWYIFRCLINRAWQMLLTGRDVVVADVDWGFRTTHLDLVKRLDPTNRFNASTRTREVSQGSDLSHGTAVMGLVGAADNDFGMLGAAFEATLWPIQVNAFPEDDPTAWAKAIGWVMTTNSGGKRKVLLLEGETRNHSNIESILSVRSGVQNAIAMGIVVCVPAGNGGPNKDAGVGDDGQHFPASGSIVVGSTLALSGVNQANQNSNRGRSVVVSAPGELDVTCGSGGDNCYANGFGGTSGAGALVAGTVALMLQANPHIRHSDVWDILKRYGTSITPPSAGIGGFLNAEDAVIAAKLAPRWGTEWKALSVEARDIGFGASEGSLWRVGLDNSISRLRDGVWETYEAAFPAVKIAVEPDGRPWYISTTDDIHAKAGGVWQKVAGKALDIAIGADGSVWRVGLDHSVFHWDGNGWESVSIIGQAVKIAVAPDGHPWYISKDEHAIFRRKGTVWEQVPGRASDIAIGADGVVWHVGINEPCEEGRMRRWNGVTWEPIDGTATAITVAPNGLPYYIDNSNCIFERI